MKVLSYARSTCFHLQSIGTIPKSLYSLFAKTSLLCSSMKKMPWTTLFLKALSLQKLAFLARVNRSIYLSIYLFIYLSIYNVNQATYVTFININQAVLRYFKASIQ
mmetsp:Transcript_5908/g.20197  ORF Transcript_5908/g.20197 Transcript_5908/m.20197 type:complete len:106 (-) Transcript_5908:1758-2075(-)